MMPSVFLTLKADPTVWGIVGGNPARIWQTSAPEDVPRPNANPYVIWSLVTGTPENNLSDPPPVDRQSIQIDCWHKTQVGVDNLATAVRDAVEPVAHMTGVVISTQDQETKLFRIGMQFDFWGR